MKTILTQSPILKSSDQIDIGASKIYFPLVINRSESLTCHLMVNTELLPNALFYQVIL